MATIGQMLRRGEELQALVRGTGIQVKVLRQEKPGLYVVQTPEGEQYAVVEPVLVLKGPVDPKIETVKPTLSLVK